MRHRHIGAGILSLLFASGAMALDVTLKAPGLTPETRSELRESTLLYELREEDADDQRILAAAQADYARLLSELYNRGYYAPVINITLSGQEAADISPTRPPSGLGQARIVIDTGPRFRFGQARIAPLSPATPAQTDFRSGQVARANVLRKSSNAAIEGWRALGHPRAEISDQQITARHDQQRLDVDIRVSPGPQLRFGQLEIKGETTVRPERIRAIAGLPTGKLYTPDALRDAADRLQRTGTFRAVSLQETDRTVNGDQMPIDAQITDMTPRRFGFGAEVSSRQGLTLSSFWLHRNLLGGAERLRVEGEIGGIGSSEGGIDGRLRLRFDRPATFDPRMDFYAEGVLERLDEPNFVTDRLLLEAGLTLRADSRRTFTAGFGFEAAHTEDAFGSRDYTLLTMPLSAENDRRDDRLNPSQGWFGRAELTPFAGISGVGSGARTQLDLRGYRSVGDRAVLALRGQLGSVIGPELSDAPTDYLFYSGGGATVRGHGYQSLGVTLEDGETTGGRSFLGASGEVRVRATDALSVVAFYDVGYIGPETFPDGSGGDWHSGAGLGLRYNTGIGPIRLDVGGPVTGNGDGLQIYIGIGQAF